MLHDTVEDTDTTPEEIEERFGYAVRSLVMEVTDDKDLEKQERKRLQIEHSPHLSPRAKVIKLADKISNLRDLMNSPPVGWDVERRLQYVTWSEPGCCWVLRAEPGVGVVVQTHVGGCGEVSRVTKYGRSRSASIGPPTRGFSERRWAVQGYIYQ